MDQEKIGKFIAENRKKKNLTQEDLAEKLGVSKNAVSKWERGLNLPDASIMLDLCKQIDITLNELFAGSKVKEKDIEKQAEKNILAIFKFNKNKNHKYKIILSTFLITIILCISLIGRFILIKCGYILNSDLKYSQVYIIGENNIKGEVDINRFGKIHIDFDIGANKYGEAVFKNPKKAMKRLKKDYAKGLKLIAKEFNLMPLSNFNYKVYKTYGWQVTMGSEEEKKEARFVSSFMDIYENSFSN